VAFTSRQYPDAPDTVDREDQATLRALLEGTAEGVASDCTPAMDIRETAEAFEVIVDLPGVPASDVRLVFSRGLLVVTGRKVPPACAHREAAFHLAERSFGHFVRAIRLSAPIDAGRATARLTAGELTIVVPRIAERRGVEIRVAIEPS
jgi:HSP20 family protein